MGVYNKHDEEDLRHALEWEVGMLVDGLDEACHKPARIMVAATLCPSCCRFSPFPGISGANCAPPT